LNEVAGAGTAVVVEIQGEQVTAEVLPEHDEVACGDGAVAVDYFMNLVRPVVFPFLHDCAAVARLRLSSVIEMRVSTPQKTFAQLSLLSEDIVEPNGDRLLWQQAG